MTLYPLDKIPRTIVEVREQGAVVVEGAIIEYQSEHVALVRINSRTKRPGYAGYRSPWPEEEIVIYVEAREDSFNLDETKPRDSLTVLCLPDFKGWDVWTGAHEKWSIALCLMKRENP